MVLVTENLISTSNAEREANESNTHKHGKIKKSKNLFSLLKKDPDYRKKFIKTCMMCWSFVNYGLTCGLFGPSLLDFVEITKSTLPEVSSTITASGLGYLTGSIFTGIIGNRIHTDLLSFLSCFGSSVAILVIPWCSILEIMVFAFVVKGFLAGIQDTAANALLLRLWKDERSTYMQALHFSWSVGSILSPLYITPFLTETQLTPNEVTKNSTSFFQNATNFEEKYKNEHVTNIYSYFSNQSRGPDMSHNYSRLNDISSSEFTLYIPYTITGMVFMTAALFFLIAYIQAILNTYKSEKIKTNESLAEKKSKTKRKCIENLAKIYIAQSCISQRFDDNDVICVNRGSIWGPDCNVRGKDAKMDKGQRLVFNSGILRVFSIFVVRFARTSRILIFNCFILCIAITGFLISAILSFEIGIWLTTSVIGVFASPVFPGILTWAEEEFVTMTRRVTSSVSVASCIGWMSIPAVVGALMDIVSPMYFSYFPLGLIITVIILYFTATLFSRVIKKYRKPNIMNRSLEV
ncbi:hypothetical protein KUTeg_008682 [Tegillarca granosa]|uniref:Uncharacterized protein n=1 Tax=Tegillarca granosa TaxID=220873 RepID=A0ABQ9F9V6_TEGGR|nr:hypothetical protein KUTeg_008682 [Tegillarca granosa]